MASAMSVRWGLLFLVLGVAAVLGMTMGARAEEGGEPIELDEAAIDIEWNSTDDDYGIHFFWDGEAWSDMRVDDGNGKTVLKVQTKGRVKAQGLTEGFFESDEPTTDELSMEEFFERFPEGEYTLRGKGLDGCWLVGASELEHTLAAPPTGLSPEGGETVSKHGFTVSFDEVTEDTEGDPVDVEWYEVVVEKEDDDPILQVFRVILAPGTTSVDVPGQFLEPDTEYKLEIVVQIENGNRTITESGLFTTDN